MSQVEMKNKVKYAKATMLLQGLLRQGIISEELYTQADLLNAVCCKQK